MTFSLAAENWLQEDDGVEGRDLRRGARQEAG